MGVGYQRHAPAALPPGNIRYPLYKRMGVQVGKISPTTRIRSPDRPVCSESQYWLRQQVGKTVTKKSLIFLLNMSLLLGVNCWVRHSYLSVRLHRASFSNDSWHNIVCWTKCAFHHAVSHRMLYHALSVDFKHFPPEATHSLRHENQQPKEHQGYVEKVKAFSRKKI